MIIKGAVVQGGADTFTAQTVLTGLTIDGKTGWLVKGFKAYWSNGYTAAAADAISNCVLATISSATPPSSDDEICRVSWGVQNTAGVAVAFSFEPSKRGDILEPRLTVQSDLYVHASSTSTGLTNTFYYEIEYELVKLTDIEVLRLMVGGA